MKSIALIGAMNIEIQLIKDSISIVEEVKYAGFTFYMGKYKNVNVVVASCGVGKVNAASCTQILIDKFNVEAIINTGISGSLNENIKVCDIVISDNVTYHDVRQAQMISCYPFKEFFKADEQLKGIAIEAFKHSILGTFNYHVGRIVTGEAFVSDSVLKDSIAKNYNACCVEMEGSAIGHVAEINGIPFIIIRSISDNADDNSTISYEEFEKIASRNSASLVLNMLELINNKICV